MPNPKFKEEDREKNDHDPKVKDRPNPKFKKKGQFKQKEEYVKPKPTNDPSFYLKYPILADTAGKVPMNHRNGQHLVRTSTSGVTEYSKDTNLDPIIVYKWMLTPGYSKDSSSAINVASQAAWKMLNRRFRGVGKYQAADFGIIQFCILDFFVNLSEAERAYGLLNYYSLNDKQVPNGLLLSLGLDPNGFDNLADFRLRLNKLIQRAKSLCLVKGYTLLDHALVLASNVFKDKDGPRSNIYAFRKDQYWVYDPTISDTGGSAVLYDKGVAGTVSTTGPVQVKDHLSTADSIIADLQKQLEALLTDDDVDQVCSDVLAFYGNGDTNANLITLMAVPEDYLVTAHYADDINRQVHNATVLPTNFCTGSAGGGSLTVSNLEIYTVNPHNSISQNQNHTCSITQQNNVILFMPRIIKGTPTWTYTAADPTDREYPTGGGIAAQLIKSPVIDTDITDPSVADMFEMTRMMTISTPGGTANAFYYELDCIPSTPIISARAYLFDTGGVTGAPVAGNYGNGYSTTVFKFIDFDSFNGSLVDVVSKVSKYDWAPILYIYDGGQIKDVIGDLDNYRTIDKEILSKIHEVALLSEFHNPIADMLIKE